MDEIRDALVGGLAAKMDSLLRVTVNQHFGHEDWTLSQLAARGSMLVEPCGDEVFCMDGKPLLRFKPPEFHQEQDGIKFAIKISQQYEAL